MTDRREQPAVAEAAGQIDYSKVITSLLAISIVGLFTFIIGGQTKLSEELMHQGKVQSVNQGVFTEQMNSVRESLDSIKRNMADRYTASDAKDDQRDLKSNIQAIDDRVRSIEMTVHGGKDFRN